MIPHWKIFYKSEHYKTNDWISRKFELGQSIDIGSNSPIELGQILRFTSNLSDTKTDLHFQTYIPYVRLNLFGKKHGYQISYIYHEFEKTFNNNQWLYIGNTGATHELSLIVHLWGGKGASECIEYGQLKHNGLLQDLKRNGLLAK